ncbi:hypothetical protein [Bradyrhizobium cenepequi]|uniref:hypothetical protein n=1 Tax=Bradyrhizobium cenepequi TaxID=2821403 RepID=UPI001CE2BC7E|nr:hypothetical protein [Bradyrhizobium cenepequi]MCA6109615.1 hypothetical protein [Bradyrhizobium cenepequi]
MSDDAPEFRISLSEAELTDLGRFYAVWSQIDCLLCVLVSRIFNVESGIGAAFMDAMTTGARLDLLRRNLDDIKDKSVFEKAKKLCNSLASLVDQRNHATHGMWGTYVNPDTKSEYAAAFFGKKGFKPLYASELAELTRRTIKKTRELGELIAAIDPKYDATPNKGFWFSPEPEQMRHQEII